MPIRVDLRCQCGAVRGVASDIEPRTGIRVVCMCDDCQAFAYFLERDDLLDGSGGTDIFQVRPAQLRITTGGEHLRCMRLSEKGLLRWYAGCCRTPIANTLSSARAPFAGVITAFIVPEGGAAKDAVLGPVVARIMAKFARGAAPEGSHPTMPARLMVRTLRFLVGGFVRGMASPSPFFDARTRQPIVTPRVLTESERSALKRA